MKKWLLVLFSALLATALAACNSTAEPISENESNETDPTTTKEGSKSELTLEEVYTKAMERQNELDSVSADMKLNQTMHVESGEESFEMTTKSNMKMDMIVDPVAMYLNGITTMADPETGEDLNVDMEMYMSEQGLYMQDSESQQWMKLPSEQFEAIIGQTANQVNATEQLEQLKTFIDDFKFEQNDTEYVLTLDAASEKFSEFILDQMQLNEMLGLTEEEQQIVENMSFDKVSYVINISKETFDILSMDMVLTLNIKVEGESVLMDMDTNIIFNNINGVKDIVVPQEVIDQAVEVQY